MYSPKICEELIPVLYHTAKAQALPMTRLVDKLIYRALLLEPLPFEAFQRLPAQRTVISLPSKLDQLADGWSLDRVFRDSGAFPFRDSAEVDAWYASSIHGLWRLLELSRERSGECRSDGAIEAAIFRDLSTVRGYARGLLTQGDEAGQTVPFEPLVAEGETRG